MNVSVCWGLRVSRDFEKREYSVEQRLRLPAVVHDLEAFCDNFTQWAAGGWIWVASSDDGYEYCLQVSLHSFEVRLQI